MGLRCHICGEDTDTLYRWQRASGRNIWICRRCRKIIVREARKGPLCQIHSA